MDTQTWAVFAVLLLAGSYLSYRGWRGWKRIRSGGCSSSCGCDVTKDEAKQPGLVQVNDLTARLRSRTNPR
ncbi:MAG TPA: hypothetical protein PLN21_03660 [Gemmatales bacterium]|nr:hypothetical protein [Gemmatales bacterium]